MSSRDKITEAYQAGKFDDAVALCRQVLQTTPDDAETWRLLGLAFAGLTRYAEAVDSYDRAIAIRKPGNTII